MDVRPLPPPSLARHWRVNSYKYRCVIKERYRYHASSNRIQQRVTCTIKSIEYRLWFVITVSSQ